MLTGLSAATFAFRPLLAGAFFSVMSAAAAVSALLEARLALVFLGAASSASALA